MPERLSDERIGHLKATIDDIQGGYYRTTVGVDDLASLVAEVVERRALESNQLPELNEKEQAALDGLPDDLIERLMNGEQWDSLHQRYVPTREKLIAALWKIRRLTQTSGSMNRIVLVSIEATVGCDEPVALCMDKEPTDAQ